MRRISTVFMLAALALVLPLTAAARDGDIDKINGAARIAAGQQAGNISSVNGAVYVGDGAIMRREIGRASCRERV